MPLGFIPAKPYIYKSPTKPKPKIPSTALDPSPIFLCRQGLTCLSLADVGAAC